MQRINFRFSLGLLTLTLLGLTAPQPVFSDRTVQPLPPSNSLRARSHHRFYYDENAMEAWINKIFDAAVSSAGIENFLLSEEVIVSAGYADGAFNSAYRVNLKTGARRRDVWLTGQMGEAGYLKPRTWKLSPDRKWILWKDGELARDYSLVATPLNQSRRHSHSIRWNLHSAVSVREAELAWFPETHRWMELWSAGRDLPTEAHLYDLSRPDFMRRISIASAHPGRQLVGIGPEGMIVTATEREVTGTYDQATAVSVVTFLLDAPRRTRHESVVHSAERRRHIGLENIAGRSNDRLDNGIGRQPGQR